MGRLETPDSGPCIAPTPSSALAPLIDVSQSGLLGGILDCGFAGGIVPLVALTAAPAERSMRAANTPHASTFRMGLSGPAASHGGLRTVPSGAIAPTGPHHVGYEGPTPIAGSPRAHRIRERLICGWDARGTMTLKILIRNTENQ